MIKPKLFSIIKHKEKELTRKQLIQDIVAGIIVAIIALPLSIALGISSGVSPEQGLITAIIAGFCISFFGGSRVQIGGPTGAFVVIVYGIVKQYGISGLAIATIIAGIILILMGVLRLGGLVQYIPFPITAGFTSGIAVVLFSTQIKDLLGLTISDVPAEFIQKWMVYISNFNSIHWMTVLISVIALVILFAWPNFSISKKVPGALIAIVVTTLIVQCFKLDVATIGSTFENISARIPMPKVPNVSMQQVIQLIPSGITIAVLAAIESLLSAVVADSMIGKKHNANMELIAQGIANCASALFGGIPATGAIARTAANVKNGGRTPIAGIVHAIVLLLMMLLLMPLAKMIPMAALGAVLVSVSYNMGEWNAFKELAKGPKSDFIVLVVTFVLTVVFDLVVAIEIGLVIALVLAVKKLALVTQAALVTPDEIEDEDLIHTDKLGKEILLYEVNGPLFFGNIQRFVDVITSAGKGSKVIVIRMHNVSVIDASAVRGLYNIVSVCRKRKMKIIFDQLSEPAFDTLKNLGFVEEIGEERFTQDINQAIQLGCELL